MRKKFTTKSQVAAYISGDLIECLECGKFFKFLGNHLPRIHEIDGHEYRELWGIPAMTPLAGQAYREMHREKIKRMQANGTVRYDHLPIANANSIGSPKIKIGFAKIFHSALIATLRPGDAHRLPPGAKRANGRDADLERANQQRRRAAAKLNSA